MESDERLNDLENIREEGKETKVGENEQREQDRERATGRERRRMHARKRESSGKREGSRETKIERGKMNSYKFGKTKGK